MAKKNPKKITLKKEKNQNLVVYLVTIEKLQES